ncbi:Bug family tripartite tricarboxylate transporter substrate binding protein [Variovorax terrae]|uniref:Tripartite tricarboxylate transporter substrate binding protein n=1 Tax=Variovorax terrae TaxID=2923278 RepID=A0A9X1VRQ4_9BURK|nr:tripartite tricarboxylate transporter substrate binding protein [Variovorax terrae]MCJ0762581.1 tripartite tricarboxylate transporter substrate binding protein [Variovorax terrae]
MKLRRTLLLLGAACIAAAPALAQKDAWPSRPIKIITPTPAGVGSDAFARIYADRLSKALKVPVVVENRPGALSTIGTDAVAKAPADGYTLLFATGNPFTLSPFLMPKLPYNPEKDFAPVSEVLRGGSFVVANKDFPAKNLRELVQMAKASPGRISFASYGPGSTAHVGFELVQDTAGIELLHVPYKQSATPDVIGGQVMLGWEPPPSAIPHIRSGRLRAIAYTGSKRNPALPDVPTLAETYPGLELFSWVGFWVPAATPAAIVERLNAEIVAITRAPDVKSAIEETGNEAIGNSPAEMAAVMRREAQAMSRLIKAKNIRLE